MIWFVCSRPCVFQLSPGFKRLERSHCTDTAGASKGLKSVFLMMPSTGLVSYEGGLCKRAMVIRARYHLDLWRRRLKSQEGKAVVPSDGQVCEVPENLQDSSSWFIKIAEDMIIVTAAPVDWSKSFERTLPTTQSSVYQSRFPGKSCARVRSLK